MLVQGAVHIGGARVESRRRLLLLLRGSERLGRTLDLERQLATPRRATTQREQRATLPAGLRPRSRTGTRGPGHAMGGTC